VWPDIALEIPGHTVVQLIAVPIEALVSVARVNCICNERIIRVKPADHLSLSCYDDNHDCSIASGMIADNARSDRALAAILPHISLCDHAMDCPSPRGD